MCYFTSSEKAQKQLQKLNYRFQEEEQGEGGGGGEKRKKRGGREERRRERRRRKEKRKRRRKRRKNLLSSNLLTSNPKTSAYHQTSCLQIQNAYNKLITREIKSKPTYCFTKMKQKSQTNKHTERQQSLWNRLLLVMDILICYK